MYYIEWRRRTADSKMAPEARTRRSRGKNTLPEKKRKQPRTEPQTSTCNAQQSVPDDESTHEHAQMTTRTRRRRPVGRPACALGTWRMLVRNRSPSAKYMEQYGRVLHVAALHAACEQHPFQICCAGQFRA